MLNLSSLKLLATVFFALFILSACGGGGGDAAAPAAAAPVVCDANEFNDNGTCVAAINPSTCTTNQHVVNNVCTNYTAETCTEFFNSSDECVADNYTMLTDSHFATTEYSQSTALAGVNAKAGYLNIEALIDTDNNSGAIKQGGAGQIVSVAYHLSFEADHQEFVNTDGTAFIDNGIYKASDETEVSTDPDCSSHICLGTPYASLIAGRKGNGQMHGVAYNANLKGIVTNNTEAQLINGIPAGVGADIIAMNHVWNSKSVNVCYNDGISDKAYQRPFGLNVANNNDCTGTGTPFNSAEINSTELTAWRDAVTDSDTMDASIGNNTIMVFSTGELSFNSENGEPITGISAVTVIGGTDPMAANIPDYHAAYPVLYDETDTTDADSANHVADFTSDRWLVVAGLGADGKIYELANGCGVAMGFCLSAGADTIFHAHNDIALDYQNTTKTQFASSTVAGALAVLKGAFPNATPEQLTRLVLETADYIALDNALHGTQVAVAGMTEDEAYRMEVTNLDGSTRYINPVYGYGKLNLATATSASATSYVTASNNESMGALWTDTKLTLSSHFGGNFESVKFGIGDAYGRHFITAAPQTSYAPVAVSLDDYMANMLADNVQSQKLGGQAQANYSNTGEQSWMNLEYISGKATTKIAFQDSYKINPLSDTGTTTILRANNIRPASSNIGMMDVDYQLGNALSLSSYLARGEYDTGYKFDELGTDFDVNYKDSHLNIGIGNIREHGQFLGTNTSGAYALNAPSISRFTDVTYGHDLGAKFNLYANYINYETDVDMLHDQFASIDGLQADQYQIGFTGKDLISKDDSLKVALITKLGVTDGALNQNTVLGYTADGAYNNASQSYDLAVNQRHQQFEITYQGKLYQNADKISALRDNRFFTSIRVDQNLNHVQGASQVEVISGINIRY